MRCLPTGAQFVEGSRIVVTLGVHESGEVERVVDDGGEHVSKKAGCKAGREVSAALGVYVSC
jgi:hypothetical protein